MRAAFQILAIPYRVVDGRPLFCVFRRADSGQWQFIAGGGEDAAASLSSPQPISAGRSRAAAVQATILLPNGVFI